MCTPRVCACTQHITRKTFAKSPISAQSAVGLLKKIRIMKYNRISQNPLCLLWSLKMTTLACWHLMFAVMFLAETQWSMEGHIYICSARSLHPRMWFFVPMNFTSCRNTTRFCLSNTAFVFFLTLWSFLFLAAVEGKCQRCRLPFPGPCFFKWEC